MRSLLLLPLLVAGCPGDFDRFHIENETQPDLAQLDQAQPDLASFDQTQMIDQTQPIDQTLPDETSLPDLTLVGCAGWAAPKSQWNCNLGGCWYLASVGESCNQFCQPHGGFDPASSTNCNGLGDTTACSYLTMATVGTSTNAQALECYEAKESLVDGGVARSTCHSADGTIPTGNEIDANCQWTCSCLH